MRLIYHLSDEARRRMFVETGRDPGQVQGLEVDPTTLTPEQRQQIIERDPGMGNSISLDYFDWQHENQPWSTRTYLTMNALTTDPAQLLAAYRDACAAGQARVAQVEAKRIEHEIERFEAWGSDRAPDLLNTSMYKSSPRRRAWLDAHAAATARAKEMAERLAAERERERLAIEAEKERRIAERAAWAMEHGSARLRKCVEQGYDCQRLYALERARHERPGYVLDFDDKAGWRERSGPSEQALDEAARVGGTVVWLTSHPGDEDGEQPACEAVVIRKYLGRYDLVKAL